MTPETLSRLTLGLYAQTVPLEVCQDAAQEMEPPRTWAQWLDESGVLKGLANVMIWTLRGYPEPPNPPEMVTWLNRIQAPPHFTPLCSAFGVPAVMIEVGQMDQMRDGVRVWSWPYYQWSVPAVSVALTTLREAMAVEKPDLFLDVKLVSLYRHVSTIEAAIRDSHPTATTFRLKHGAGDWRMRETSRRPQ